MKQNAFLAGSLALCSRQPVPVVARQKASQPGAAKLHRTVVVSGATSVVARSRISIIKSGVTLKGPKGNIVQVKVGEDAPYSTIEKGRSSQSRLLDQRVSLRKPGELAPTGEESRVIVEPADRDATAKNDDQHEEVAATVQNVDYQNRHVTLKGTREHRDLEGL